MFGYLRELLHQPSFSYTLLRIVTSLLGIHLLVIPNVLSHEECSHYVPGSDPMTQPVTYCSPRRFGWNCSSVIPGTTWHFLDGYVSMGRCCVPVYGSTGTFKMCERNGEADRLIRCKEGTFNWNSPFSSRDRPYPHTHANWVCKNRTTLADADIPRIEWNHVEYITRDSHSVTLLAVVYSSTRVVSVSLFRDQKTFPVLTTNTTFQTKQGVWIVHLTLVNVTTADDGSYYAVVTNTRANGRSSMVHLTVIRDSNSSIGRPVSFDISCMWLPFFITCFMITRYL
ncbi:uncharacterized protein [Argopecten irradians]|uniref:uncharacterized protein isoform X2 n=1 Tax=Argopecten irradians TaxID=31199 RepID=UPI0037239FD8